ncbi:MAG: HAMP domain-containing histidine kinase [Anaerolineales bacterium]|nr:HAMP domain-containing histidine kinase [Anaerolineales bacterium]
MFASLRSRLLLSYALLVGVVLFVVASALLVYLVRNPPALLAARLRLQTAAESINQRSSNWAELRPEAVWELLERYDEHYGVRALIYDASGVLLLDTRQEVAVSLDLPRFGTDSERRTWLGVRTLQDSAGQDWLATVRAWGQGNRLMLATERPDLSLTEVLRNRGDDLLPFFRVAGLVAILLSLLLAIGMARWIAAPLQRIDQAARKVAVGLYQPIQPEGPTEVRSLAGTFNEMAAQVQVSQRSQRDFVANVSHDLKTPLTSIQGFAQALLDGTAADTETIQQSAEVIAAEAARMQRMVADLLDLARWDAGMVELQREPVDLNSVLTRLTQRLSPQASAQKVTLGLNLTEMPPVIGAEDRLTQLFSNLVDNAIQHSPPHSQVIISSRVVDGWALVQVQDQGAGIPLEERQRVFERFYQVDKARSATTGKSKRRGSGLGLAIANEIALAHGGQIWVESQSAPPQTLGPGQGSTFVVKLPFAVPDDSGQVQRTISPGAV